MAWHITLVVLLFAHWLADFTAISTPWMLRAKRVGWPIHPIFCHAFMHAFLSFWVTALAYRCVIGWGDPMPLPEHARVAIALCAVFILLTHWGIDILKGAVAFYFPVTQDNTRTLYWAIFGMDQMLHIVVLIVVAAKLEAI
jgi:hypothetical protein